MDPHGARDGERRIGSRPLSRARRASVVTIILAVVQAALVVAGRGTVPLPTGLSVSIASVPASVAGIAAGPLAGALVGGVFGVLSFVLATTPLFQNPVIAILPRIVIGPTAAVVYAALRRTNQSLAFAAGGAAGAVVGTGLVLLLAAVVPGPVGAPYISPSTAWAIATATLPAEAALAAVIALLAGHALKFGRLMPPA